MGMGTSVTFSLTAKQREAQALLGSGAQHILLEGGSRSGKTFLLTRSVVARAVKAPGSRHAILRLRFNHLKASVILDTFPKVMKLAFGDVKYELNKSDWYAQFWNDSQIWFGGLDEKDRTEKVLGQEHATIYLNEASQIPFSSRNLALTRLAQKVYQRIDGRPEELLPLREYCDCNPPSKRHWLYQVYHLGRDPDSGLTLPHPESYAHMQINPQDNAENTSPDYLETLRSLPPRLQRRFLLGQYAEATPNALFDDVDIDKWRHLGGELPDMLRIVVSIDPSGASDNGDADQHDMIGIVVVGLGTDGNAYLLEDCSVSGGPSVWGRVACDAYDRWDGDCFVGEGNYGGGMVEHVIKVRKPRALYKMVTATRGKAVRAEPISALYSEGKVRHVGQFPDLEDELCAFSTTGYTGNKSPNRADALVWGMYELFPSLVADKREKTKHRMAPIRLGAGSSGWMLG